MSTKDKLPKRADLLTLWYTCEKFIADNEITCPETIHQMDHVIVHAYNFVEEVTDIVGYHIRKDEDV